MPRHNKAPATTYIQRLTDDHTVPRGPKFIMATLPLIRHRDR